MNREMKDSGIAWIGEIPKDWETERLQWHLTEIKESNNPVKTTEVLSLTNKLGVIPYEEKGAQGNVAKENYAEYKLAYPKTIVANSMNILIGSVGICNYFGCVSPVYYVLKPNENDNLEFLNYIFQSQPFHKELRRYANGILEIRLRLSSSNILKRMVAFPSLEEQAKIVETLNIKCKKVDSLISNQEQQIEKLKAYKQSLITEVVTKGLDKTAPMKDSGIEWIGEINASYNISTIKSIFTIKKIIIGKEPDTVLSITQNGLKVKDINNNVGQMANSYSNYQMVEVGDFAMNHMDLLTGGIGISEYNGVTSPDYRVFVLKNKKMNDKYFLYVLQTYYKNKVFYAFGQGAANLGRWRLPAQNFNSLTITVPSLTEQTQIANYLDKKCSQIDKLISIKQTKIEKVNDYKKSLIYEYVTGKKEAI
ncbi:MAG: restriction endonuclease subunit S [Clostridia bacterium]|nr:restriction endonuclease subunit S [Clostridia bacterium]